MRREKIRDALKHYYDHEQNMDLQNLSIEEIAVYWHLQALEGKEIINTIVEAIKNNTIGGV